MRFIPLILLTALLSACSDSGGENKKADQTLIPPTIHEESLRNFTGARTKVVWTQYQNPDKVDKQANSNHHHLYAIDSANGRGAYKVLEEKNNYAYPIITPDGKQIVFTRKGKYDKGGKRSFKPSIEVVNFDGSGLKKLGNGYAQEVWEDPETGKFWVYAGEEFILSDGTAPICKRIVRFLLEDPSTRETVWDKTEMGTDSFAISRDGKRFAGLFPWPQAGVGNLETNTWEPITNGCWTSMAPDNSYTAWVFDGPHKNVHLFEADGSESAKIRINSHPKLKGHEVYHPRWGNDVGYIILSGPHTASKGKGAGAKVEIFIGKFSKDFDQIESWHQVTDNGLPDLYPDLWIEGGNSHEHQVKPGVKKAIIAESSTWPNNPDGLVFKWKNIRVKNEFQAADGSTHTSRTEAQGHSHYGPNYEMKFTSGSFHPILDADALLIQAITNNPDTLGLQTLLTAESTSGNIFSVQNHHLDVQNLELIYSNGTKTYLIDHEIEPRIPTHIAISLDQGKLTAYIDGAPTKAVPTAAPANSSPSNTTLTLGENLDGSMEHLAFYDRPLTPQEVASDFAIIDTMLTNRMPIPRTKLKGKLVATSPLPTLASIDPYLRALVHYEYETEDPNFKHIAVAHWAILDSETLPGLPREIGQTYDLLLEPITSHPQLESQSVSSEIDETLMLYYDVTPLAPKK